MKRDGKRTTLAFVLTVLAVAVPCVAWYLVGSREAEHQATALLDAAGRTAHETALRLAEQLTQRLNALREAEARRPFYHYQALFHDPKGASEGASVVPSPLATGPNDPLIQVYFQADGASGRVTIPSANVELLKQLEQIPTQQVRAQLDEQRYLQRELERGVASILFVVRGEAGQQQAMQAQGKVAKTATPSQSQQAAQARVEIMEQQAWVQNVEAAQLYNALRSSRSAPRDQTQMAQPQQQPAPQGNVQILVGALKWRTVYVASVPSLVAMREVTTPQRSLLQGFLISRAGLTDLFQASSLPVQVQPGTAAGLYEAPLDIGDEPWRIVVDAGGARAAAERRAQDVHRSFLRMFLGGVGIAAMAGLCVVGIVWQSERLARQRVQFAASAAHELRTPLAGLRMYSEMLAEGLGDPARAKDYARRLANEAERLGRVVANVLGFTRLERGTLQVHPEPGDLAAVVRECVVRHQPALETAGAQIDLATAENLPAAKFDGDAVAQILQNLLDNAEKHTRAATDRTIHVSVAAANSAVALTIADHGPGIPAGVRRHLFEAFARGNQADAPAGLGLGLVLVKALAQAQGAAVTYSDNAGGGAKFTVSFPS